ncbi:MAG: protein kinase, partial [Myxococcales bacterium]|nr:protein kinase [Myxococcales bacterium]
MSSGDSAGTRRRLGQYELDAQLGQGGMGTVWRAHHVRLDRPAAIKLIHGTGPARELALRFEREVKATASLRSPHTVAIYDYGVDESQTLYYAMELLDGVDLDTLVRLRGPLPVARVIHLLIQACESLAEAHAAGLVHRDVKPANLFVCRLGRKVDFVKVLDFGLVRRDDDDRSLTRTDATPGSPAFMAPESIEGEAIGPSVDIYALGGVAYWLLTGKLVFERDSAMRTLLAHVRDAVVPPSSHVAVPHALDTLVVECLAKTPAGRPPSMAVVQERLLALATAHAWSDADAERAFVADMAAMVSTPLGADRNVSDVTGPDATAPLRGSATLDPVTEADRERARALLRRNFAYSGIAFTELEQRSERVGRAGSRAELDGALAGLPAVDAPPVDDPRPPASGVATARPRPPASTGTAPMPRGAVPSVASNPEVSGAPDRPSLPVVSHPPGTLGRPGREATNRTVLAIFSGSKLDGRFVAADAFRPVSVFGGIEIDLREATLPYRVEIRCLAVFGGVEIIVPPDVNVDVAGHGIFGGFSRPRNRPPLQPDRPTIVVSGFALFGGVS